MPYKDHDKAKAYWRGVKHPRNDLHRKLGLTRERYYAVLESQGWACALCHEIPKKKLVADHCHETGVFRGMLCMRCNTGLGKFGDDPEMLLRAVAYLAKSQ